MHRSVTYAFLLLLILLIPGMMVHAQDGDGRPQPPGQEGAQAPPAPSSLDAYVAGWVKTAGMFEYFTDETTKRVLLSLKPDQLEQTYFASVALTQGTGDRMLTAPMMWGQAAVKFRRVGEFIEVYQPNYQFTTVEGEPMARAVETGVSETIMARVQIEAESETDGRTVIDLATVLMALSGADPTSMTLGGFLGIDPTGSYVERIKGFPENDEIDARVLVYGASDPFGNTIMGESRIGIHYSLSIPPPAGYMPRLGDDRVGYFVNLSMNYSVQTDREDTRYIRYVQRWRLEKADPAAEVSEPKQPIVFWLENTIPLEYRDAVRDGILAWNAAFERIGIHNAIQVKQMPDNADWDPADARYHTIRWFVSPASGYAIGPSLVDPRTGEIYDADIGISADMLRVPFQELQFMVGPLHDALAMISPPGWPNLDGHQVKWDQSTMDILESRLRDTQDRWGRDLFPAIHMIEGARAAMILQARGEMAPGSPEEAKFIHDYTASLVVHEVGHTLGLKHNFAGSAGTPFWKLNQSIWTSQHGLSQSVMDYTTTNISPTGKPQGEYFQTRVGDYDSWAIEYAYKWMAAAVPQDEKPSLDEIASRAPAYRYAEDIDAMGWSMDPDPDCQLWDLSDDLPRWCSDRIEVSQQLLAGILQHWSEPGTRPAKIRNAFGYAIFDYMLAGRFVPRLVGGVRLYRDHVGDPNAHAALVPVSAEDQRRALMFCRDKLWSSSQFQFDPQLLRMLGQDRNETFDYSYMFGSARDYDIHALVLDIQSMPLYWLYDPVVLQRIINNESRMLAGEEPLTMVELFDTVRTSIWSEVAAGTSIDSYRRNLQRSHLEMIIGLVLEPAPGTPEDAVTLARRDLVTLRDSINSLLSGAGKANLDEMTVAHLEETLSRINLTLTAPMVRGVGQFPFALLF